MLQLPTDCFDDEENFELDMEKYNSSTMKMNKTYTLSRRLLFLKKDLRHLKRQGISSNDPDYKKLVRMYDVELDRLRIKKQSTIKYTIFIFIIVFMITVLITNL